MITKKKPNVYVSDRGRVYDFRGMQEFEEALKKDPLITEPGDNFDFSIEKSTKGAEGFMNQHLFKGTK